MYNFSTVRITLILAVAFLFAGKSLQAQVVAYDKLSPKDSLRLIFQYDSARIFKVYPFKIFGKLENRYNFLNGGVLNTWGIMQGITFNNRHSFYIGYFGMNDQTSNLIKHKELRDNMPQYLEFNYVHTGYRPVLFDSRRFRINLPMFIGIGNYKVETQVSPESIPDTLSGRMVPMSLGLHFIYKIKSWAGLACSGGYQYFYHETNPTFEMQAWYYTFGIWLDGYQIRKGTRYHFRKKKYREEMEKL